ncbi:MAG TPA: hypothetical protein VNG89_06450, partial [Vicinamibacterales bacterium]|nr:hypothetical protein [Vicinamibacterales bacterium]
GSETVTLQSAFPQPGAATIAGGSLTAPVVYVGRGTDADLAGRDLSGRRGGRTVPAAVRTPRRTSSPACADR